MEMVSVVEFTRQVGPYRTGDQAGFSAAVANSYVKAGAARMVKADTPAVDPKVMITDSQRKLQAMRDFLTSAERDAKDAAKADPIGAASTLESLADMRTQLDAFGKQLANAGVLKHTQERLPSAGGKAS